MKTYSKLIAAFALVTGCNTMNRQPQLANASITSSELKPGDTAVITWGSATGPVREALSRLREQGRDVRLVSIRLLAPERPDEMAVALEGVSRLLVVEQSHSRQFYRYLRAGYDMNTEVRVFNRPGPLPFRPAEIIQHLSDWDEEASI